METSRDDFVIAIRSAFLKKGTQQRFSLFGLISFSIIFLILGSLNLKFIDYLKISIKDIVYRSSFIISVPENFLRKNYLVIQNHLNLYEQNEKNLIEVKKLRSKDLDNKIITFENIKYKKLIDDYFIKENEVYAKALIDKKSPFLRSIVVNKGSKDDIKLGMIVLDENYLVGKIVEVNYFSARVLLLSDINSKIPVLIQPGNIQAIMSGNGNDEGNLSYIKNKHLINDEELTVTTSGAGGLFKSGIPIGKINKENNDSDSDEKIVNFYKDFSQLTYVKVLSFKQDNDSKDIQIKDKQIKELDAKHEIIKILLKQKKITEEIRIKIEDENIDLKNKVIILKNELANAKIALDVLESSNDNIKFMEMNILYGKKCKKTFLNNLYKVGTPEYKNCVLNKGIKKKD
jgi:rod shape-determining protein MreC